MDPRLLAPSRAAALTLGAAGLAAAGWSVGWGASPTAALVHSEAWSAHAAGWVGEDDDTDEDSEDTPPVDTEDSPSGDTATGDTETADTATADTATADTATADTATADTATADTATGETGGTANPAPNFLIIIADDLGVDKVGAYAADSTIYTNGATQTPVTPNIDELASAGLRFTRAWAEPLCTPTRSGLQTGRHPFRTGTGAPYPSMPALAPAETTIAELLTAGNADGTTWSTGLFGKWHLGSEGVGGTTDWTASSGRTARDVADLPNPVLQGYGVYDGFLMGSLENYYGWTRVQSGTDGHSDVWTETAYPTDVTADAATEWINDQEGPWLAVVAFNAPHADGASEGWEDDDVEATCAALATHTSSDDQAAVYRALVECMDTRIGDMLRNLRADDLANTYIVFIGDNGTPWSATQGDQANLHGHSAQGKNTAYESGIRVPYIVTDGAAWAAYEACPAGKRADGTCSLPQDRIVRPGRTSEAPVHTTDLFATVAELADVDASSGVDSQSILPCFFSTSRTCSSPDGASPRVLYSERFICDGAANPCAGEDLIDGTFAIRRGRYKLLGAYDQTNACIRQQMFDLATDTWEQFDVSSRHPRELAALELELLRLNPGWQADLPRCP